MHFREHQLHFRLDLIEPCIDLVEPCILFFFLMNELIEDFICRRTAVNMPWVTGRSSDFKMGSLVLALASELALRLTFFCRAKITPEMLNVYINVSNED